MEINTSVKQNELWIKLSGDARAYDNNAAKIKMYHEVKRFEGARVIFDAAEVSEWDSTAAVVLFEAAKDAESRGLELDYSRLPDNMREMLRLAMAVNRKPEHRKSRHSRLVMMVGEWGINLYKSVVNGLKFMKTAAQSVSRFARFKAVMRKVDLWFALEDCSYRAIGIVSLVSFMVGLILAFVGAIQLKMFGAQIYVASLVAIGMTWIMGAIMAGIIMAGRTGAAYAATIGTMQVNEEIDALKTMGLSTTDFLILPRIISLVITMPILTMLADAMGMLGGWTVGVLMLGVPAPEYWKYTLDALNMTNFLVGTFHGFVYGIVIALCGCYYGINCGRNADSVGVATTKAVVSAIVWMIVVTGFLTFCLEVMEI